MKEPVVIEFPNKFKLVYETPKTDLPISSIYVFCDIGSIYEMENKYKGSSHFIEHMCFKGTKNNISSVEINNKFGEWGSQINASTEKRMTYYIVKCQNHYLQENIHLLADMLLNSSFDKKEYEKELRVVIEECIKDKDDPDVEIDNIINGMLLENTNYSYPVDDISFHKDGLNYNDIFDMYKSYYIPNRMVFSICTHIPIKTVISILRKTYFCKKKQQPNPEFYIEKTITYKTGIQYKLIKYNNDATRISIGFNVTSSKNVKDMHILMFLRNLFNNMYGRLFLKLREENGMTYESSADTYFTDDIGVFIINIVSNNKKTLDVLKIVISILNNLWKNEITKREFLLVHGYIQSSYIMSMEDSETFSRYNGKHALYGEDIIQYENIYDKYFKNITIADIKKCFNKYFKKQVMCVSILGKKLPELTEVKKICEKYKGE
jgi:predicted Zn-dependent peptidase